jgi:hypothetical protein
MSGSVACSTRFITGIVLAAALVLAPTVLPSGSDSAEARTKDQCNRRFGDCVVRCSARAGEIYGAGTKSYDAKKAGEYVDRCENRTCRPQQTSCLDNASDPKKPTKAVSEPSSTGPTTKVQPKWQPGKIGVPDKAVPVTRVPPRVQPMGGVQSSPVSRGPTLRRTR